MRWGDKTICYWQEGDEWVAEWADRAMGDADRNEPDTIKLYGRGDTKEAARTSVMDAYNAWLEDRR